MNPRASQPQVPGAKPASLYDKAVGLLARREHSASELAAKLAARGATAAQAQELVAQLAAKGLQSDRRFAQALATHRASAWGRGRIMRELAHKKIDPEIARQAVAEVLGDQMLDENSERSRALAVLQRRYAQPASDERERQRQLHFLLRRGFAGADAQAALRAHRAGSDCD